MTAATRRPGSVSTSAAGWPGWTRGPGIRAEVSGRGLLTHESAGFRQRGIAGRLGWDPTPGSNRGPSLTLSQTMGVSAQGGADALLGRTTLAGLAANDNGDELERRRLEVKLDYGFGAFGNRFTATPEVGFGMSASHRDYSLVWRFVRDRRGRRHLVAGVLAGGAAARERQRPRIGVRGQAQSPSTASGSGSGRPGRRRWRVRAPHPGAGRAASYARVTFQSTLPTMWTSAARQV